ncbi:MAG TPA: FHA domain-containing protein [Anaerolineales bacterium]|nr:FHA domain-containing protein [Anaerolineales bacterium]
MEDKKEQDLPVLIAQTGPLEGQRWTIDQDLLIGRDARCDIMIITPDKQVSRQHARIQVHNDHLTLEDLGSKNGTHINSDAVKSPVTLEDGDTIQIALAQQFVYLSSDATVPLDTDGLESSFSETKLLRLDKRARRVMIGSTELDPPLSVAQFTMLQLLYEADGNVVTRHDLISAVWGEEHAYDVSNQALDALVRRLRDRLAEVNDEHSFIITVRGHGLRLDNPQV